MYVSYTAPHWPLHAPEETIEKYEDKFDLGWDRLRRQRYQRLTKMGPTRSGTSRSETRVPAWENAENKAWQARRMAVYAAMVDRMDQGIGQMVEALEETGQLENTLILFLSDNGGSLESFGWVENRTYADNRGVEPSASGEVQTSLYPRVTREGEPIQLGNVPEYIPADTTYQAYGRPWANVSNTPFREYKSMVHEGGIATPMIAHWPAGIEREGELERQPGHIVDLMATAVDLGNAAYPDTVQGSGVRPIQGISLMPALQRGDLTREEPLFFEHRGNRALRDGKWKAVAQGPSAPWELYNMDADRTETNDLSEKYPERLEEMTQTADAMARRFHAVPWPYGGEYGAEEDE